MTSRLQGCVTFSASNPSARAQVEDVAELIRREPEGREVDRAVHVVEAVRARLGHVQRRGEGRPDARCRRARRGRGGLRHGLPVLT